MTYFCSECKIEVPISDGLPVKSCECDAPIVAEMESTLHGVGGVN